MRRVLFILCAIVGVSACGKDYPTGPSVSSRQIVGPCWVSALLYDKQGRFIGYASLPYNVCPPIAEVDSLGLIETVKKP